MWMWCLNVIRLISLFSIVTISILLMYHFIMLLLRFIYMKHFVLKSEVELKLSIAVDILLSRETLSEVLASTSILLL